MVKKQCMLTIFCVYITQCREYPKAFDGYFSQKGQDKFLNENIFKNKKNGTFVEIGAHDGISFSNTCYFQKNHNWSGMCIEPNPDIFEKLKKNRKCYCEKLCISNDVGKKIFLKCSGYLLEMYRGLLENIDPRHLQRIENEIAIYGGDKETITVDCVTCKDLFRKYNMQNIDLLSIDIEGGEESAIRSIYFDAVKIEVIVVENNFNENNIKKFLLSKNYKFIKQVGKDDIYKLEKR